MEVRCINSRNVRIRFSIGGLCGAEVVVVPDAHACASDEIYAESEFERRCFEAGLRADECTCCVDTRQFDWCEMEPA